MDGLSEERAASLNDIHLGGLSEGEAVSSGDIHLGGLSEDKVINPDSIHLDGLSEDEAARAVEREAARVAEAEAKNVAVKGAEKAVLELGARIGTEIASETLIASMTGPFMPVVEAVFLVFTYLTTVLALLDVFDVGGYGKMQSTSMYKGIKAEHDKTIALCYATMYPPVQTPVLSGPIDTFTLNSFSQKLAAIMQTPNLTNEFFGLFERNLLSYLNENPNYSQNEIDVFAENNLNSVNSSSIFSKSMEIFCQSNGGVMKNGSCSWSTKQVCETSYTWPPPLDNSIYVYSEWVNNTCQLASYSMKAVCETNHINYDKSTGTCSIDENYCLRKGASWKDGECYISPGQKLAETIFSATVVRGLDQIFDPAQYESCNSDETDDRYFCRKIGCDADKDHTASLCYNQCNSGYSGVATVCYEKCPNGWTDDGLTCRNDSCPNDQFESAGLCYNNCNSGYHTMGLICYEYCADGYTNLPGSCLKNLATYTRGVGRIPGNKRDCGDGEHDDGLSCWSKFPWHIVANIGDRTSCNQGDDYDAGLCYTPCNDGYNGAATICTRPMKTYIQKSYILGAGSPAVHISGKKFYDRGVGISDVHIRHKQRLVDYSNSNY